MLCAVQTMTSWSPKGRMDDERGCKHCKDGMEWNGDEKMVITGCSNSSSYSMCMSRICASVVAACGRCKKLNCRCRTNSTRKACVARIGEARPVCAEIL